MEYTCTYQSPLGDILLAADEIGLTGLWFEGQKYFANTLPKEWVSQETPILTEAKKWLDVYFSGEEPKFTPRLHPDGSSFRQAVLEDPAGNSLWADGYIWRDCRQNRKNAEYFSYVGPGSRWCGGA